MVRVRQVVGAGVIAACWLGVARISFAQAVTPTKSAASHDSQDPRALSARGEAALAGGNLDVAEQSFKGVLALDPKAASAYANLGVVAMRRKQWAPALVYLRKAEKLAPHMAGVRLNIGLAYYRENDFWHAIPAFESVVTDQPDSVQARALLGQCYFFTDRWVEAVDTLEPIWPQQSRDLNYLYVLYIAADKAERKDLSEHALARLAEVGGDSAEVRLLVGKAKLNLEAYDDAVGELRAAATADPKLPFVHFYLGMAYSKKGDYAQAEGEFLKDIALEPDVVFNYAELGNVYFLMEKDAEAEKAYEEALKLDPRMLDARLGLAKVLQRQRQYARALTELAAAGKLDPNSSQIHYLRGQTLIKMGRKEEGKAELQLSVKMSHQRREQRQKELEGERIPNPELSRDTK
jgi:tetratricopeptide (TPR) repeat protein